MVDESNDGNKIKMVGKLYWFFSVVIMISFGRDSKEDLAELSGEGVVGEELRTGDRQRQPSKKVSRNAHWPVTSAERVGREPGSAFDHSPENNRAKPR